MNILIVHNAYQRPGGEDTVVEGEAELLRGAGHHVHVEIVHNSGLRSIADRYRTFVRTPYDSQRGSWMRELVRRTDADIVHVHNFFPLLTPAIHEAASASGCGVVQTLHNYRLMCANAMFLREGRVCEKCIETGWNGWAIIHKCYRNSALGSLAVARMQKRARAHNAWQHVHRFIALTEFARSKFITSGISPHQITIKPNFVKPVVTGGPGDSRTGALFVGRLSREKGVQDLLAAWRSLPHIPLTIIGDGPERNDLEKQCPQHVRFIGHRNRPEVLAAMRSSAALIVPSLWYEGFPMTVVEAYASGTPVFASRIGSLNEVIEDGVTGGLFNHGSPADIVRVVGSAFADVEALRRRGLAAKSVYDRRYTPEVALRRLEEIYDEALSASSK